LFCVPTQKVRHLVGSFTRGMELPAALDRLFAEHRIRAGHLDVTGQLEGFTLQTDGRGDPVTVSAPALILRCGGFITDVDGKVAPRLMATLQFSGPLGPQMVGGLLVFARILSCEFRLDAFDDVFIVKKTDPRLLFPAWSDCFTESPTATAPGTPEAFTAPNGTEETPDEPDAPSPGPEALRTGESEPGPGPGDIVEHFKFGACRVQKVDSGDMLDVWLPSKNKARLSMQVLQFDFLREDPDGTRYFQARPQKHR
jgi:hypothetical protein